MFNRIDTIETNLFRLDKIDSFTDRFQLESFTAVKWVRPGTRRTLEPLSAIRYDLKVNCTVQAVLLLNFSCQRGKPVINSIMPFATRRLCFS